MRIQKLFHIIILFSLLPGLSYNLSDWSKFQNQIPPPTNNTPTINTPAKYTISEDNNSQSTIAAVPISFAANATIKTAQPNKTIKTAFFPQQIFQKITSHKFSSLQKHRISLQNAFTQTFKNPYLNFLFKLQTVK